MTDIDAGVGAVICELKSLASLLLAVAEGRAIAPNCRPELNADDMRRLGQTLRDLAERLENRLKEIEDTHNAQHRPTG